MTPIDPKIHLQLVMVSVSWAVIDANILFLVYFFHITYLSFFLVEWAQCVFAWFVIYLVIELAS